MSHTLKAARRRAGLSIAELSRRSGLTPRTIYRLERGTTRPMLDTASSLEKALGLKRGELTFGPDRSAAA